MKFKTDRIKKEFNYNIDNRVKALAYMIDGYCKQEYGYIIKITDGIRTDIEHKEIYGSKPAPDNIHATGRAIDFIIEREDNGDNAERAIHFAVTGWINEHIEFNKDKTNKTAVYHAVQIGDTGHIHLQVSYLQETRII